jgi:hypothetical protein
MEAKPGEGTRRAGCISFDEKPCKRWCLPIYDMTIEQCSLDADSETNLKNVNFYTRGQLPTLARIKQKTGPSQHKGIQPEI